MLLKNGNVLQEPFNRERIYGNITRNFDEKKDKESLKLSIMDLLEKKINVKHCVEVVPIEIALSLVECGAKFNYKFIFLYRHNSIDRLLSYFFAKNTGIWGPGKIGYLNEIDETVLKIKIPIQELYEREKMCRNRIQKTWDKCVELNVSNRVLTFENLYNSDIEEFKKYVIDMINFLNVKVGESDLSDFVEQLRNKGNQKTKSKYSNFSGIEELYERLSMLDEIKIYSKD
jgi:hypothetical protein